jgi:hypothetical protein
MCLLIASYLKDSGQTSFANNIIAKQKVYVDLSYIRSITIEGKFEELDDYLTKFLVPP